MADEYTEPTNEQLASFLVIYAPRVVGLQSFNLSEDILKKMLDENDLYRQGALRHHRRFQEEVKILHRKLERGQLQCEHELKSGKRCPNFNEPGRFYCGLHGLDEE